MPARWSKLCGCMPTLVPTEQRRAGRTNAQMQRHAAPNCNQPATALSGALLMGFVVLSFCYSNCFMLLQLQVPSSAFGAPASR
mmetsp:Transcript_43794/g.131277  ORF Transcript_43794/g.131277 Transcript_43794/m.131277 type:complete len:83 (-) Transcript_43794:116-364(-)